VNTPFVRVPLLFAASLCSCPATRCLSSSPRGSPGKQVACRFHLDLKRTIPRQSCEDYGITTLLRRGTLFVGRFPAEEAPLQGAKAEISPSRIQNYSSFELRYEERKYSHGTRLSSSHPLLAEAESRSSSTSLAESMSMETSDGTRFATGDDRVIHPAASLHLHGFAERARAYYSPSGSTWRANSQSQTRPASLPLLDFRPVGHPPLATVFGVVATGCRSCH